MVKNEIGPCSRKASIIPGRALHKEMVGECRRVWTGSNVKQEAVLAHVKDESQIRLKETGCSSGNCLACTEPFYIVSKTSKHSAISEMLTSAVLFAITVSPQDSHSPGDCSSTYRH